MWARYKLYFTLTVSLYNPVLLQCSNLFLQPDKKLDQICSGMDWHMRLIKRSNNTLHYTTVMIQFSTSSSNNHPLSY